MSANWLGLADDDPWGLDNLPYGCALTEQGRRGVVRVGDRMLDLTAATGGTPHGPLFASGLDRFLAAGRSAWREIRALLTEWFTDPRQQPRLEPLLAPVAGARLVLPFAVSDYVDFYASEHHASNVGRIFRPKAEPLPPNWKYLPIGYHGRAGTIVVSGTDVVRPNGQFRDADDGLRFGPSAKLDIEAEVAFVVGSPSAPGIPVPISGFGEHVFGVSLLNDWSARDIQAWEYVPLGPFLGKSFATSISAWVTPLAALDEAWTMPPPRDPRPFDHLDDSGLASALDLALEVRLNGALVARPPFSAMYWTPAQQLAHLTSNGATVRTGDVYASGTVSGPEPDQRGCLLELTWNATRPLHLDDGTTRGFLQDGDEVVITATAPGPHGRIALGEVRGRITPARAARQPAGHQP